MPNNTVKLKIDHQGYIPFLEKYGPIEGKVVVKKNVADKLIKLGYNVSYRLPEVVKK
jgi:hypothetical protein